MPPPPNPLSHLLTTHRTLTLDGALATQLEHHGADLANPLWSTTTLLGNPSLIRRVHYDYFMAGADVAITASYQSSERGLAQHRGMSSEDTYALVAKSVELAQEARDEAKAQLGLRQSKEILVAGSVGPYGAYLSDGSEYTGAYALPVAELKDFHRLRMRALVDAGADLLACETIPSFTEVCALLELLQLEFPQSVAWVSVTLDKNGLAMADGTPLSVLGAKVLERRQQILAVGVNCVPRTAVTRALKELREVVGEEVALLAYPNSGEEWDARTKSWSGEGGDGRDWKELVEEWRAVGMRLVGGCCRTGPEDVKVIKDALEV